MGRGIYVNFTFESVDGNGKDLVITDIRNDSNGWDIEVTGSDGLTEDGLLRSIRCPGVLQLLDWS